MEEKEIIHDFINACNNDDLNGALAALKKLSAETINDHNNEDDYDMLIQATVSGNPCAVEALLNDGRCDLDHRENLCGMTAAEFAADYDENSRIRQAFRQYAARSAE